MIRKVLAGDTSDIGRIYNYYIVNTAVTFEEESLTESAMRKRIQTVTATYPWLVYCENGHILGYANATQWKARSAYKHTVESGIYIDKSAIGRGIGKRLYKELIRVLSKQGYHAVIASIALPNPASIALHEKFGFRKVGHFREIGNKFGKWRDVGYWELLLTSSAK
jgi:L-amino acid N-acyltransferase YncA